MYLRGVGGQSPAVLTPLELGGAGLERREASVRG
jgi:hypothetical protein